jgi:hypothetical protein
MPGIKRNPEELLSALVGAEWDDDKYEELGEELGMELLLAIVKDSNPAPFLATIINDPNSEGLDACFSSLPLDLVRRCLDKIEGKDWD